MRISLLSVTVGRDSLRSRVRGLVVDEVVTPVLVPLAAVVAVLVVVAVRLLRVAAELAAGDALVLALDHGALASGVDGRRCGALRDRRGGDERKGGEEGSRGGAEAHFRDANPDYSNALAQMSESTQAVYSLVR